MAVRPHTSLGFSLKAVFLFSAALLVEGCGGAAFVQSTSPSPPASATLTGKLVGGQQPIRNAAVQLLAAGSTGYGAGAVALTSPVHTDVNGDFSFSSSDFTCPSSSTLTYLVSKGGDPGTGADNPAIALMATLGSCGNLANLPFVVVNEVTTISSVWELAQFLSPGAQMGTSSTNSQGLLNAFANVNNLVNIANGTAPGSSTPQNAVIPVSKINTLADILATCINTGSCNALFAGATPENGAPATNTLDAALNIARNPTANVAALFAIPIPSAPFQPTLNSAPADWTLAVTYSGGGLHGPAGLALDAAGNVWTANYFNSVTELSSTGDPLSPASGFTGGGLNESYGIAVAQDGTIWVTNEESSTANNGHGSLTVLNPSGQAISGTDGYYGGGVYFPVAVASDSNGNIWTANYGDSTASLLLDNGSAISGGGGFAADQLSGPVAVAIDANHNAWFANQSGDSGSVTSVSQNGVQVKTTICCGVEPSGIAIDSVAVPGTSSKGHVWTANYESGTVSELELGSNGSVVVASTGYSGAGLNHPNGIAVDGAGNVWVTNFSGDSLSELQGAQGANPGKALSPNSGLGKDANLGRPYGVAIDASGNLWVSNFGLNTITEFLGAASPVRMPLNGPAQLP